MSRPWSDHGRQAPHHWRHRKRQPEEAEDGVTELPSPALARDFIRPMMQGDSVRAGWLVHRINAERSDPFVELRSGRPVTISDTGRVRIDPPVIAYRWTLPTRSEGIPMKRSIERWNAY